MNKYIKQTLFVIIILAGGLSAYAQRYNGQFTHSTYIVPQRFNSEYVTSPMNYEEFDFLYIMAAPMWEAKDFDLSQEEINKKYVDDFDYNGAGKGMSQVEDLIKNIKQTGCKIICCFPPEREYDDIANNGERRKKFARMIAAFIDKYGYDGIDLDWEQTVIIDQHTLLMTEIREALNDLNSPNYLYLTTALATSHKYTQEQADALSAVTDWINLMSYGMGGGFWSKTVVKHNTPFDLIKQRLEDNWSVFSPDKLCVGLANYGFGYHDLAPYKQIPADVNLKDRFFVVQYKDFQKWLDNGWTEEWDKDAHSSFYYSPDGTDFFSIDTPSAIKHKLDWVFKQNYRGVFWWEFHMDWIPPTDKDERGRHILIDSITEIINNKSKYE